MPSPTSFSKYLSEMLTRRGAMARLSEESGVNHPHISKIAAGDVLPSTEVLSKLIKPMEEEDRLALVREYLLLHLPDNAPQVRIIVNDQDGPKDRLQRAVDSLDGLVREDLAALVEAVNRSPEQGHKALKAMSAWFKVAEDSAVARHDLPLAADREASYGGGGDADGDGDADADETDRHLDAAARAYVAGQKRRKAGTPPKA